MQPVIHIFGASGSGTTTLGRCIAGRLQLLHMDTDDYFWLPTDPKFTNKRPIPERLALMNADLDSHGGDMHQNHLEFLAWAACYGNGPATMRSSAMHDAWQRQLSCPLITLNGENAPEDNLPIVQEALISRR